MLVESSSNNAYDFMIKTNSSSSRAYHTSCIVQLGVVFPHVLGASRAPAKEGRCVPGEGTTYFRENKCGKEGVPNRPSSKDGKNENPESEEFFYSESGT